jgi:uncharacterized protein DUF3224
MFKIQNPWPAKFSAALFLPLLVLFPTHKPSPRNLRASASPWLNFSAPTQKEASMPHHAKGTFDVKLTPQPLADPSADKSLGRMSSEKQFHGDMEGSSKGEMLSAGSVQKGSAGYVAIEFVTATLQGRSGTFVFQHSATMDHGAQQLSIIVVPDSGTGQLTGITGKITINIVNGKHFYDFEYTLPEAK